MTSRPHCCASPSASRSCSRYPARGSDPQLALDGRRGEHRPAELRVPRPWVGVQPVDQRPEIHRNLAPACGSRRQPVQNQLELIHHAVETGVQAEQGLIQRACLAGLHPLQTGHQHLLEQLRVKISDGELDQAASDGQRCGMRIVGCPAIAWWQAGSDPRGQVLDGAPPGHTPGLLVLQQLSHRVELGLGEIDGGAGRCPHQAAQVVRAPKSFEPALGRTSERIRRPVHRHGDGRRAEPGPEQPRDHRKRLPAPARAPGDRPNVTGQ